MLIYSSLKEVAFYHCIDINKKLTLSLSCLYDDDVSSFERVV
jgi:hypothetical protein